MDSIAIRLAPALFGLLLAPGASVQAAPPEDGNCQGASCQPVKFEDAVKLGEIVVTGSHIRGTEAAGSKLIVIDREQIDTSGYGRVEDVLATVTQNFNRANSAVSSGEEVDNLNRGSEVQLRGLGLGTTMMLVNGQRQGASGFQGSFTDVSTIPASAVERIEVLPEGAAALYGSDAIGGVVNIILRRNFEGFETRVRASTASGDANERAIAQLWGRTWSGGHVLLGMQYNDSAVLACGARAYCAANSDFRRYGGSDLRGVASNPGTILDRDSLVPIAAIPHGQDGTQLTAEQLIPGAVNYANVVTDNDILPKQEMRSAFLSASHHVANNWELSVDGQYSSRTFESTSPQPARSVLVPETNAFNHLGEPVLVAYDVTTDIGPIVDSGPTETTLVSAGATSVLPKGWQINLSAAYSKTRTIFVETNRLYEDVNLAGLERTDPTTALNVFGDGSHSSAVVLAELQGQASDFRGTNVFTTKSANVIADGLLGNGPAGAIRLAVGSDFRKEHSIGLNIQDEPEDRGREVVAVFFEFAVPVVAPRVGSNVDRVALSLAGRYERYSDAGTTFNPKLGLTWQPFRYIKLRGNWGTSVRAPPFFWSNADELGDSGIFDVADPQSPTEHLLALGLFGPYPDLKPETAESWMIGMDIAPPDAPNYSLSLSYFEIDYLGKIHNPGPFAADFLTREDEFASLITRNPTRAQIDAVCHHPDFGGDCNQPIDVILDNRFRNLASLRTRGVDVAWDYSIESTKGEWNFGLNGTYTIDLKQQITTTAPVFNVVNTVGYPLQLRVAGHLSWSLEGWSTQATVNHTGHYQDPAFVPARGVDSWTTVDLNFGYRVDGGQGWLAETQFNLGIINLLDQRPPFVNQFNLESGTLGYDAANATLLGRQISLQAVKRWGQ